MGRILTGCKKIFGENKELLKGIRELAKLESKLQRPLYYTSAVIQTALLCKGLTLNCRTYNGVIFTNWVIAAIFKLAFDQITIGSLKDNLLQKVSFI